MIGAFMGGAIIGAIAFATSIGVNSNLNNPTPRLGPDEARKYLESLPDNEQPPKPTWVDTWLD